MLQTQPHLFVSHVADCLQDMMNEISEHDDHIVDMDSTDSTAQVLVPVPCRSPYQYRPLEPDSLEIRLLTLFPGSFTSEVRVSLTPVHFADDSDVNFEALSYTWGSPENKVDIFVGDTGYDVLKITKNLAEALPYLRYEDHPRVLWIDAISVNQEDLDERSSQVRRMAKIYSKAARVIVWLGPASFDSRMAIDCLELIASKYRVDRVTRAVDPITRDGSDWVLNHQMMPLSKEQHWSVLNFLHRDWFERLWIWQEVHASNDYSLVVCGNDAILWKVVLNAVLCIKNKPSPTYIFSSMAQRLDEINFLFLPSWNMGLMEFSYVSRFSKCVDPRDRVFALLGMLGPDGPIGIEPDYSKDVHQVFIDTTMEYIEWTEQLQLLCGIDFHGIDKLPSWVYDWTARRPLYRLDSFHASGLSAAEYSFVDRNILRVTGISVTAIEKLQLFNVANFEFNIEVIVPELRRICSQLGLLDGILQDPQNIRALCEILCSYRCNQRFIPGRKDLADLEEMEELFHDILTSKADVSPPKQSERVCAIIARYCHGRCLFVTEDGRLGLGPKAAMPGDLVTAFLGCQSPMILRLTALPASNSSSLSKQQYKVVGESNCLGVTDNEALLGPLPAHFDTVWHYKRKRNVLEMAYIDQQSGEVHCEDPRLGPLPEFWTRKKYENEDEVSIFLNEKTGEETGFDPRLNADHLRAMGVKLEYFDLI